MKWINALENPPICTQILVSCKKCKNIHSVFWSYEEYCLAEHCYEDGHMFTGGTIDFDWYMPLPKPPHEEESPAASSKQDDSR